MLSNLSQSLLRAGDHLAGINQLNVDGVNMVQLKLRRELPKDAVKDVLSYIRGYASASGWSTNQMKYKKFAISFAISQPNRGLLEIALRTRKSR